MENEKYDSALMPITKKAQVKLELFFVIYLFLKKLS
mgnify:CR=1 FL=1